MDEHWEDKGAGVMPVPRSIFLPLRILVLRDMVDVIIGLDGATIRKIIQQSKAMIDIRPAELIINEEDDRFVMRQINIMGITENCSRACQKILELMQQAEKKSNGEVVPLKIIAHNSLIGRIIEKNGFEIDYIREITRTWIKVSSAPDFNDYKFDGTITIKGKLENVCKAEGMISKILRETFEMDLAAMGSITINPPIAAIYNAPSDQYHADAGCPDSKGTFPPPLLPPFSEDGDVYSNPPPSSSFYGDGAMYGRTPPTFSYFYEGRALHSNPSPPTSSYADATMYANPSPYNGEPMYPPQPAAPLQSLEETVFVYIPNSVVGTIIGTGGRFIREMIQSSGCHIMVSRFNENAAALLRKVCLIGTPRAQYKAQSMIFQKVGLQMHKFAYKSNYLKVEIFVPTDQVGRIIGKSGQIIKELQRQTRAIIQISEQSGRHLESNETSVLLYGDFCSTQAAQRKFRALLPRLTNGFPSGQRQPVQMN